MINKLKIFKRILVSLFCISLILFFGGLVANNGTIHSVPVHNPSMIIATIYNTPAITNNTSVQLDLHQVVQNNNAYGSQKTQEINSDLEPEKTINVTSYVALKPKSKGSRKKSNPVKPIIEIDNPTYLSKIENPNKIGDKLKQKLNLDNNSEDIQRVMIVMEFGKTFTQKDFNTKFNSSKFGFVNGTSKAVNSSFKTKYLEGINDKAIIEYDLSDPSILIELANNPDVKEIMIEPIQYLTLGEDLDGPGMANENTKANIVHAMQVNGTNLTGKDYSVCLVDSGVNYNHPDLIGHIILGRDTRDEDDDPMDTYSHGTKMAGMIHIAAPEAKIVAVRACDSTCGTGDVAQGIQWCVDNKDLYNIKAISISSADGASHPGQTPCPTYYDTEFMNAVSAKMFNVAASGNDARLDGINYPACSTWTVSAGSTYVNDTIWEDTNRFTNLDILAPGARVNTTQVNGDYVSCTGTSCSAPYIAGAAAILYQNYELHGYTNPDFFKIRDLLKKGADKINDTEGLGILFNRVNIEGALAGPSCYVDEDCNGWVGNKYCQSGDVYQNFTNSTCSNPGWFVAACSGGSEVSILKEDCTNECFDGECIECNTDLDCGTDTWLGNDYCSDGDVWDEFRNYSCINPGTSNSSCEIIDANISKEVCPAGCSTGECSLIDLIVKDLQLFRPSNPNSTDKVMFKFLIENIGTITANNVNWYCNMTAIEKSSSESIDIAPGQEVRVFTGGVFNTTGNFNITAIVDYNNTVIEINESNNEQIIVQAIS